ncbi:MAG: phosphoglycerate dehydrogenase [Acidimicrobiales bacterium]
MSRILVTENLAEAGLDKLRAAGHEVDVQLGLSPDELLVAIRGAHALVVRSATTVSADVIAAGVGLVVVGRAGVGLDNIDVEAATRNGVTVVNAPHSNSLSAAEHTMALMLAQARNIPAAHAALTNGRWERSQWIGTELAEKTLGIIGLGRIGKLVAERAQAFGMRLIGHDPFVSPERSRRLGVEMMDIEEVVAESDFLTLHVARTPETVGMIDEEMLARAKPNLRLINVARGGIIDEVALADAIREGRIAGAALDVFSDEPCTTSPLFDLPQVLVTPHLGASTFEAQDKAGTSIAEQVILALDGEFVPFAVNVAASEATETIRPFLPLAEQLGALFAGLSKELPSQLDLEFAGEIGGYDNKITELSVLKGLLSAASDEIVSYVNAPDKAKELGLKVRSIATTSTSDYVNLITLRGGDHAIAGTLGGVKGEPRIVLVDDHLVDLPPTEHMLVVRNDDRPGVVGRVGTVLGESGINIADMNVGRSPSDMGALMVLSTTSAVPDGVVERLEGADGVVEIYVVSLTP